MSTQHQILQVGLGTIGREMARRAAARKGHRLIGAVDAEPAIAGADLKDLLAAEVDCRGVVVTSAEEAIARFQPDVALVSTVSDLASVARTVIPILEAGIPVISTCEPLAYPFITHPDLAAEIDEAARRGGAACLGTGVNPGFVLDFLPVVATAPSDRVDSLRAQRVVDAASRRRPLQRKIGAGLDPSEFEVRQRAGRVGHAGFTESLHFVCTALGLETAGATTFLRPVLCEEPIATEFVEISPGQVCGIHQGGEDRDGRVILDLEVALGAPHPGDRIRIEGEPSFELRIDGGVDGDVGTCAMVLNAIPAIRMAEGGLKTMLDVLPLRAPPM